ncbi:MAG: sigma-54 dependent transcriptional regulator [Reichenbachiella sp.]
MKKDKSNILIIDDDPAVLTTARLFLKQKFAYVHTLSEINSIDDVMETTQYDIVLLDMNYTKGAHDGAAGLVMIDQIVRKYPKTEIIPITAYGEIALAVEALKRGARDFVTKPWQNEKLYATINNILDLKRAQGELGYMRTANRQLFGAENPSQVFLGESKSFVQMKQLITKVAPTDANILILGENGSGKELVARQLHLESHRRDQPFVKIDLGALVDNLFESELFGHVRGAFTDAQEGREGKLQMANGGTLFLDEIGNISLSQQAKLLSVLQDQKVTKIGSNKPTALDIRILCATNIDIFESVKSGTFRQDLLYRINTIEIVVPSLRDRKEDIGLLSQHYVNLFKNKYQKKSLKVNQEALKSLEMYTWPGNIRELSHVIERTVILANHPIIGPADLELLGIKKGAVDASLNLEGMEKKLILKSLEKNNGNMTHAARELGIDRQALYRRLEKYGL